MLLLSLWACKLADVNIIPVQPHRAAGVAAVFPFKWDSKCVFLSLDTDISVWYRLWGSELCCGVQGHSPAAAKRGATAVSVWKRPGKLKGKWREKPGLLLNGDAAWPRWTSSQTCQDFPAGLISTDGISSVSTGKLSKMYCSRQQNQDREFKGILCLFSPGSILCL